MKFSKKTHEPVGKIGQLVKKPEKHDANLQKNSSLYFQVGLILTLLITYSLFEMNFETKPINLPPPNDITEEDVYAFNDIVRVYEEEAPIEAPKKRKPIIFNDPVIIDDGAAYKAINTMVTTVAVASNPPINIQDVPPVIELPEEPLNIMAVEQVPIYPGCEMMTTNNKRRKCMSDKIGKLISKTFNSDLVSDLDIGGKQRIYVQFKINNKGIVSVIKVRAPHIKLEREAVKVVNKIPRMIPGKQRDRNVAVLYNLPIVIQVQ